VLHNEKITQSSKEKHPKKEYLFFKLREHQDFGELASITNFSNIYKNDLDLFNNILQYK